MSIGAGIAIYFVFWWMTLFVILPWGVRTQHDEDAVEPGTAPSAPVNPFLLRKFIATTIVSAILFALFVWARLAGVGLDAFPFLPDF